MSTTTSTKVAVAPAISSVVAGTSISATTTFQQMLAVLNELSSHTHVFYDDYGTACNCNCVCACVCACTACDCQP